ncbi:hypothetical protein LLG46_10280 [bacterium]|nr:hypothetical protein [bacterium]
MSIRTVKVCEECGKQTTNGDSWLVMSSIEIRYAGSNKELFCSNIDLDLCSPGCLLRYISRNLEHAQSRNIADRDAADIRKLAAGRAA